VGPFYPSGTKSTDYLTVYAERYDTVEIDATYYAVPAERTVEGWALKTSPGFLVAAKFPRDIVHGGDGPKPDPARVLDPDHSYPVRDRFLEVMERLGERLGPLVLQLPHFRRTEFPSAEPFLERLDRFLGDLPHGRRYAVEIRNRGWLTPDLADLCRTHGAALVLVDRAFMPHGDEVMSRFDPVTADFSYVRLLGDHHMMDRITTTWDKEVVDRSESLVRWAEVLVRMLERTVPTVVYANNHYAGYAPGTVEKLRRAFHRAAVEKGLDPGFPEPTASPS
jgi:uncharacterized protein YecE (DUF72 family)